MAAINGCYQWLLRSEAVVSGGWCHCGRARRGHQDQWQHAADGSVAVGSAYHLLSPVSQSGSQQSISHSVVSQAGRQAGWCGAGLWPGRQQQGGPGYDQWLQLQLP